MAFATPSPLAGLEGCPVVGWIDDSDCPSRWQATHASALYSFPPGLLARENPVQIAVELVRQWPDVVWGPLFSVCSYVLRIVDDEEQAHLRIAKAVALWS